MKLAPDVKGNASDTLDACGSEPIGVKSPSLVPAFEHPTKIVESRSKKRKLPVAALPLPAF